jgi:hypothetical protein
VAHILEHGLSDLSLWPLTETIGSSARILIHHFGSKKSLIGKAFTSARSAMVLPVLVLQSFVAMLLDGLALTFFPALYGPTHASGGAWILWGLSIIAGNGLRAGPPRHMNRPGYWLPSSCHASGWDWPSCSRTNWMLKNNASSARCSCCTTCPTLEMIFELPLAGHSSNKWCH